MDGLIQKTETEEMEAERLREEGRPDLAEVPVKIPGHPEGLMLLIPVATHVVVVPTERVAGASVSDAGVLLNDSAWSCMVVQSEDPGHPIGTRITVGSEMLRRSVPMRAVMPR